MKLSPQLISLLIDLAQLAFGKAEPETLKEGLPAGPLEHPRRSVDLLGSDIAGCRSREQGPAHGRDHR